MGRSKSFFSAVVSVVAASKATNRESLMKELSELTARLNVVTELLIKETMIKETISK